LGKKKQAEKKGMGKRKGTGLTMGKSRGERLVIFSSSGAMERMDGEWETLLRVEEEEEEEEEEDDEEADEARRAFKGDGMTA
jgi:hypothetical protein